MKATPGSEEAAERSLNSSSKRLIGKVSLRVATYPSGVGSGRVGSVGRRRGLGAGDRRRSQRLRGGLEFDSPAVGRGPKVPESE